MSEIKRKILKEVGQKILADSNIEIEDISYDFVENVTREDLQDGTFVVIDRIDNDGDKLKVPLINTDVFQRNLDPTKFSVMLLKVFGGRQDQYVGVLVRKDYLKTKEYRTIEDCNIKV